MQRYWRGVKAVLFLPAQTVISFLQLPFLSHTLLTFCGCEDSDQFKTDDQESMIPGNVIAIILRICVLEFYFDDACQSERWVDFTGTKIT